MYGDPVGPHIEQLRMSGLFGTRLKVNRRSSDEESTTGNAPNTDGTYEAEVVLELIDIGFSGLYQPACAYGLLLYMACVTECYEKEDSMFLDFNMNDIEPLYTEYRQVSQ